MRNLLRRIFVPPVFPDDEDATGSAAILNGAAWTAIFIMVGLVIARGVPVRTEPVGEAEALFVGIALTAALTLYLMRRVSIKAASFLLIAVSWLGLSYLIWNEGVRDVAFFGYSISILMAGLFFGWRGALLVTILSILSGWGAASAETAGLFTPAIDPPLFFARDMTAALALLGTLSYLTINRLQIALRKSRNTARELTSSNTQLNDLHAELEHRVEERTAELQKRAAQMEAVASVARNVAAMQDLDTLLPGITRLIGQQFGFYHVGVFLVNESRKQVVLQAANSEGGLQMIRRRYTLPLDHQNIIGYSILIGEPRIAIESESAAAHASTPELPETQSEMALPLRVAGRAIGALDVHSTARNAFSPEDIRVLTTLADQVAIAIENARLYSEARTALNESQALFEKYTRQEWTSFARQVKQAGFLFDGKQVTPLEANEKRDLTRVSQGLSYPLAEKESGYVTIPIKLRGQIIGVLDVRAKKGARVWKPDEIKMLEAAAERAALALETARLVESAQRRAARERAIGDISARIGTVSNLEAILQTAVEELGRKIGGATEVTLEIAGDDSAVNHEQGDK